jgi:hypothetical protein
VTTPKSLEKEVSLEWNGNVEPEEKQEGKENWKGAKLGAKT